MRIRRASLCAVLLVAATCSWGQDAYKAHLIEKYPFYNTAIGRFAPVYPALARQIVQDFGITKGVCVDVGGGCGTLAIALAKITDLNVYMLDIDPWAVRLCNLLVDEAGLTGRIISIEGAAQDMYVRDSFADLVVSRGSIFFWPDQLAGVLECYRILKPGGVAYIGGGFSRILDPEIRTPLAQWKRRATEEGRTGDWRPINPELVRQAKEAGIAEIRLEPEPIAGSWLTIRKPAGSAN